MLWRQLAALGVRAERQPAPPSVLQRGVLPPGVCSVACTPLPPILRSNSLNIAASSMSTSADAPIYYPLPHPPNPGTGPFAGWLVGPSTQEQSEVDGALLWSKVKLKRCRYLEASGCKSQCLNICKAGSHSPSPSLPPPTRFLHLPATPLPCADTRFSASSSDSALHSATDTSCSAPAHYPPLPTPTQVPTQRFFAQEMGVPLYMKPNFDDLSCELCFGEIPPPIEADPAFTQSCFATCAVATAVRRGAGGAQGELGGIANG